jgi:hypothetical protein
VTQRDLDVKYFNAIKEDEELYKDSELFEYSQTDINLLAGLQLNNNPYNLQSKNNLKLKDQNSQKVLKNAYQEINIDEILKLC